MTNDEDPEPWRPASPDDIELSDDEEAAIILKAVADERRLRFNQAMTKWNAWQYRQEKRKMNLLLPENLWFEVFQRGRRMVPDVIRNGDPVPSFKMTGYYGDVMRALCHYFCNSPGFEQYLTEEGEPMSLRKGILLIGPVGCRKTSMMRLLSGNVTAPFMVTATSTIISEFRRDTKDGGGEPVVRYYSEYNDKGLLVDDIGAEPASVKTYGNESSPIWDILNARHQGLTRGWLKARSTHGTTNLSLSQLEERYGERAASRIREMFNIFTFPADEPDYRH